MASVSRSAASPGSCPSTLQPADIDWTLDDITVAPGEACRDHLGVSSSDVNGCSVDATSTVHPTSTGFSGQANLTVNCPAVSASQCMATFDVVYKMPP